MIKVENIATIGNEIAIAWSDGQETYLDFETLRKNCPCANCQGEPDAVGFVVKPVVKYNARSFVLLKYEVVGGYAIQFHWGDGHSTGIYGFEYLRKL